MVGERMDNLIHASATPAEAEREIKLWFKPNDIPPLMRLPHRNVRYPLLFPGWAACHSVQAGRVPAGAG